MKRFLIILLSLSLIGCTTTRAISVGGDPAAASDLEKGDEIIVVMVNGTELKSTFESAEPDVLVTRSKRIPWDSIEEIKHKKFSGGKTAGATVLTTVAVLVAVMVLGTYALGEAFDDAFDGEDDD